MSQQRRKPKKVKIVEVPPEPRTQLIGHLKPKTKNQDDYIRSMCENDVVLCTGPAGSGKSHVALGLACQWLASGKVDKIVITRPVVETGKKLGFLPGGIDEKFEPHVQAAMDELRKFYDTKTLTSLIHEKKIELVPLAYMRGRTISNSFIILEEAQNATGDEIKMFITRIGQGSNMVLSGDYTQSDLPKHERGAFSNTVDCLDGLSGVGIIRLEASDIQRHPLIGPIIARLGSL